VASSGFEKKKEKKKPRFLLLSGLFCCCFFHLGLDADSAHHFLCCWSLTPSSLLASMIFWASAIWASVRLLQQQQQQKTQTQTERLSQQLHKYEEGEALTSRY